MLIISHFVISECFYFMFSFLSYTVLRLNSSFHAIKCAFSVTVWVPSTDNCKCKQKKSRLRALIKEMYCSTQNGNKIESVCWYTFDTSFILLLVISKLQMCYTIATLFLKFFFNSALSVRLLFHFFGNFCTFVLRWLVVVLSTDLSFCCVFNWNFPFMMDVVKWWPTARDFDFFSRLFVLCLFLFADGIDWKYFLEQFFLRKSKLRW